MKTSRAVILLIVVAVVLSPLLVASYCGAETTAQSNHTNLQNLNALFFNVTAGLPASWKRRSRIDQWKGIRRVNGYVVEIVATQTRMRGTLNNDVLLRLRTIFPKLRVINLSGHELTGLCDLSHLPYALEKLDLEHHRGTETHRHDQQHHHSHREGLEGDLNISALPDSLVTLNLRGNRFSGPVDWKALRGRTKSNNITNNNHNNNTSLRTILLDNNAFNGSVALETLPQELAVFGIAANNFSKEIILNHLPPNLTYWSITPLPHVTFFCDLDKPFPTYVTDSSRNSKQLASPSVTIVVHTHNRRLGVPGHKFADFANEIVTARRTQQQQQQQYQRRHQQQQQQQRVQKEEKEENGGAHRVPEGGDATVSLVTATAAVLVVIFTSRLLGNSSSSLLPSFLCEETGAVARAPEPPSASPTSKQQSAAVSCPSLSPLPSTSFPSGGTQKVPRTLRLLILRGFDSLNTGETIRQCILNEHLPALNNNSNSSNNNNCARYEYSANISMSDREVPSNIGQYDGVCMVTENDTRAHAGGFVNGALGGVPTKPVLCIVLEWNGAIISVPPSEKVIHIVVPRGGPSSGWRAPMREWLSKVVEGVG